MKARDDKTDEAKLRQREESAGRARPARSLESVESPSPEATRQLLHALRTHQIELEAQNEELRRTQVELDVARAQYFDLYDLAPVGYITLSEPGLILQANLNSAALLGVTRGDLVRQPLTRFIVTDDQEKFYLLRRQLLATGEPQTCELRLVKQDGTFLWAHLTGTPAPALSPSHRTDADGTPALLIVLSDVTERLRAEEVLRESGEKYSRLYETMRDAFVSVDMDGRILDFNSAYQEMLRYTGDELRALTYVDLTPQKWHAMQAEIMSRQVIDLGHSTLYEKEYRRKDGTVFPVELRTSLIRDSSGQPLMMWKIIRDITTRKQVEVELRTASQKLRLHFEQTPMAVVEWDLDFRVTSWNPAAETIFGYSLEDAVGQHASFMVPDAFRHEVDHVWHALLKQSGGERSTNENVRKDGTTILCEWYNTPLIDERGVCTGAASLVHDVTESRRTQQLLAWEKGALEMVGSGESLHDLLDRLMLELEKQLPGALCSVLLLDDNGINLRHGAAPSMPEAYNRLIDGIAIGPTVGSCGTAAHDGRQVIVSDIGNDPLWADFRELAQTHDLHACWSTPICSGEEKILGTFAIYYRTHRHPIPAELEVIARAVHITRIVIERSLGEAALRGSEQKFRMLFENASGAIFLIQGDKFVDCNLRTLEIFGCQSRDQIVGHPPYEFSPPFQPNGRDSSEFAIEKITAALTGQPQSFEWMHTKLDGTPFLAEVSLDTVALGNNVLLQAIVRDITASRQVQIQRAQLDRKMQEAQKLEGLGVLAGGIAHDFNNILAAILGNVELVRHDVMGTSPQALEKLEQICRAGTRARDLVQQILSFSRRQPIEFRLLALAPVIEGSLRLLRAALPARLTLAVECDADIPFVRADATQVEQIVINLVSNAMQAIHGGPGHIDIRLDTVLLDAEFLKTHSLLNAMYEKGERRIVRLSVRDDGPGMDHRTRERIFEPFFTTKPLGEGTGLGLSVVHGIVQGHEGAIEVESEPGKGTTFTLYLPVAPAQVGASGIRIVTAPDTTAPEADSVLQILCLDDDESVMHTMKQLLELRGHRVSGYINQREALDTIRAAPGRFDVVVTDYNMPGMQGLDVARKVRAIQADLPVVVTSGFIDEELRIGAEAAGVRALIPKPFMLKDFYAVVERLAQAGKEKRE